MTAQASEIIVLDNVACGMHATPFRAFLSRIGFNPQFKCFSVASHRGYVARWEVFGNRLF